MSTPGTTRPRILFALNEWMWSEVSRSDVIGKLNSRADFTTEFFDLPSDWTVPPPPDAAAEERLVRAGQRADALVVSHGAPLISGRVLDQLPSVRFVGELEGDRFAARIDVQACAERGIPVVDTNNFCSPPVAEWALALMLMGLRNYGTLFRRAVVDRDLTRPGDWSGDPGYLAGELTAKTVGLVGFGHIARRLLEYLAPFKTTTYVHDPYVPRELAEAYGVTLTSLDNVMALSDVVVCLVPATPRTAGMIGKHELGLLKKDAVFVNVARGSVVDAGALLAAVQAQAIIACLDVTDPEPLPAGSPLLDDSRLIISPHIAGVVAAGRPRSLSLMIDEIGRHFAGHETLFTILPRTLANRSGAEITSSVTT